MANTALDRATAQVVSSYVSLAIAFVVIAALSALIATQFGGKTSRQRKATFSLVSAICFVVYMTMIFPRILGAGTPTSEPVPVPFGEAPGAAGDTSAPDLRRTLSRLRQPVTQTIRSTVRKKTDATLNLSGRLRQFQLMPRLLMPLGQMIGSSSATVCA